MKTLIILIAISITVTTCNINPIDDDDIVIDQSNIKKVVKDDQKMPFFKFGQNGSVIIEGHTIEGATLSYQY